MYAVDFEQLSADVRSYKTIVLYGIGDIAREVKKRFDCRGISIAFCVVTKKNEDKFFENNVFELSNSLVDELKKPDCIILIATLVNACAEIEKNLSLNGIANYKRLIDYYICSQYMKAIYAKQTKEEWIAYMDEWYQSERKYTLREAVYSGSSKDNRPIVLMIVGNYSPRFVKLYDAMKSQNFCIVCIFVGDGNIAYGKINSTCWERAYMVDSLEEIIHIVTSYQARFIYIFSNCFDYHLLAIFSHLIERQEWLAPIVFDEYDVGMYYNLVPKENKLIEKYCVQNAAFVCDRAYEIRHMIDIVEYRLEGQYIQLMDGCSSDSSPNVILREDRCLSLCYGGGIDVEEDYPEIAFVMSLAELCNENRCHLYIYPPAHTWEEFKTTKYKNYILLSKECEYFHFEMPVSHKKLINLFATYDFGIIPRKRKTKDASRWGYFTAEKSIYCATNKLFDYIDAGIPIIADWPEKLVESLFAYDILINACMEDYDFEYFRYQRDRLRKNVPVARENLQVKKHIIDLLQVVMPNEYGQRKIEDM